MHKKMTITLDAVVADGLYRTVERHKISQFIEDLLRPHVVNDTLLEAGYRAMSEDKEREIEATEWCNALCGDAFNATR